MATNMSLQDIVGSPAEATSQPIAQGMKLAQAQQDMQKQKQEVEGMQEQLQQAKWNSFSGMMNTYLKAPPAIRKAMKGQLTQRFGNIGADPAILDAASDDALAQSYRTALDAFSKDPNAAALGTQAMQSLDAFHNGATGLAASVKERANLQVQEELKRATMEQTAELGRARLQVTREGQQSRERVGMASAGVRLDGAEQRALEALTNDKEIVPIQNNIQQAKKDYDLIQMARTEGLTPLKAEELVQSYVGLLKGMSNRSTGSERESLAHTATDMATKLATAKQRWGTLKGPVKYENEPFLKEIESSIVGLHGTLKNSMVTRLNEKTRKSSLPGINKVQEEAYRKMLDGADLEHKAESMYGAGAGQASGIDMSKLTPDLRAKVEKARAAGYSDEAIKSKLMK